MRNLWEQGRVDSPEGEEREGGMEWVVLVWTVEMGSAEEVSVVGS